MPYKDYNKKKNHNKVYGAAWYDRNKDLIIARTQSRIESNRIYVNKLKENPCMDCGVNFPSFVMDFHHRDRSEKYRGVSTMVKGYSLEKIIEEIAKCDLICANCHRIRENS